MPHETPTELDPIFDRDLIPESEYKWFWTNYWNLVDSDAPPFFWQEFEDQVKSLIPEEGQATLTPFQLKKPRGKDESADQKA